jgi:hypothetical protein
MTAQSDLFGSAILIAFRAKWATECAGDRACSIQDLVIHQLIMIDGDSKPGPSGTL